MRPSTILKVVAAVVGGVVLLFGLVALVAINSLRDPPFDPPEVAPLGRTPTFQAGRIVETDAGYVVAGVVGTSDPLRGRLCSGRFALLYLDEQGRISTSKVARYERQSCPDSRIPATARSASTLS